MSTLRKMAEAKKARIMAEAEREAAQVDRDMEQLEQLAAKYGLSVTEPAPETMQAAEPPPEAVPKASALACFDGGSRHAQLTARPLMLSWRKR